jgi:hypothetical protein
MRWIRGMVALATIVGAAVFVAAPQAHLRHAARSPAATVQWFVDGNAVGSSQAAPSHARDFHATWTSGGGALVWTANGKTNSDVITAPPGADGVRFVWNRRANMFKEAVWTEGGRDVDSIPIASGSNGAFVNVGGVFTSAFWSDRNGNPLRSVDPAEGANGVQLTLRSAS